MSDNDEARGMSDELKIEITAEDLRTAREMLRRSEIAHCFRCLNPAPPGPDPPGWGIMSMGQPPNGFCPLLPGMLRGRGQLGVRLVRRDSEL
jgi:hypothetical protein